MHKYTHTNRNWDALHTYIIQVPNRVHTHSLMQTHTATPVCMHALKHTEAHIFRIMSTSGYTLSDEFIQIHTKPARIHASVQHLYW